MPSRSRRPATADVVATLRAAGCVFAEDEADLLLAATGDPAELAALVARRVAGEPLEQVLGWAEFHGLRIAVDPGVFVPRRRTEFLVDLAAERTKPGAVVLDLCCGSGALGAALAAERPGIELVAADLDPAAVRCAQRSLEPLGGRVFEGDLFVPLPADLRGRVDVLLVNVPYVPTGEIALMPPEARLHEPRAALDGGAAGVSVHASIVAAAGSWLRPGGTLLIETGRAQAARTARMMARSGGGTFTVGTVRDDDLAATVVAGERCPVRRAPPRAVPGR